MGRSINTLCVWHRNHWLDPRDNPPKLSTPWTQQELQVLGHFTDRAELSWAEIKKEVPHRSKAEIEFELIRMWVGDKAWGNERESFKQVENESGEPEAPAPQPCDKPANASNKSPREHVADTSSIYGEISEGAALPDDDYDPFATISSAESSPSKLSAIRMDNTIQLKNCPPKRHSPVKQLESTQ
ncbi:hypothetical protein N7468_005434 [Penicillium chermesinum]|uniref:Myb-like domain-containing protein n=1 Tax=Penicillium chermesinum TaxID=63820 RepID=A0A9W9TND9_9EURO|nr:uncharacterized protein N7468_005434 [Penicillium chermesinum]KAJ5232478.1 hypothetical protein N7468_005434 [Penicillium chermesinum]KAJ6172135.1 hypothetical protein N7470_001202 [Penicillium chermesinum]